jgi:YSIRK-targeted surface antigen transcriptional regulator
MNLVSQGDIQLLKSGLTELGTSVLPILTSSSLKTEKNYTVIILEKLASLAIQVGKDIVSVIRLRNFYIKKVEEQTEFVGVLATRDSAIIHFTEELHGVSNQARTSLIRCVLQYINLKIYDNIKVTELAKQFYLSESALRSRFKEEIGVPINEYVNKRKIEESKMMIWSGIPAGEIARRLSFYDLSHYYRTFKKYTGVTPQQFRDTNIIGQEM